MQKVILFRNLKDKSWKYSIVSTSTTEEETKKMIERDKNTYSFQGVYSDHIKAMEVSKKLDGIFSQVTHLQLNPDTQHLYDGEPLEEY